MGLMAWPQAARGTASATPPAGDAFGREATGIQARLPLVLQGDYEGRRAPHHAEHRGCRARQGGPLPPLPPPPESCEVAGAVIGSGLLCPAADPAPRPLAPREPAGEGVERFLHLLP